MSTLVRVTLRPTMGFVIRPPSAAWGEVVIETVSLSRSSTRLLRIDERLVAAGALLGTTALAWFRLPAPVRSTAWAEDGALFLAELEKQGFWPTLFKPYTGYLQFWPRVLTELAVQPGLLHYAGAVTMLACLAVGAIACGVFVWSRSVVRSPLVRVALAVAPVLVPMAPLEVLGNLANLHWFVLWGCAWLLVRQPATRWGAVALAALAASFSLTEIQVAVLLPLLVLHLRSRRAWIVRSGLLAGMAVQICSSLLAPRVGVVDHLDWASSVAGYFINGPLAAVIGDQMQAGALLATYGLWVAYAAALPFLTAAVYAMVRGSFRIRVLVATLLLTSVATWFAAIWMNVSTAFGGMFGYASFTSEQFRAMSYFRYGFIPSLCLLGVALLAAGVLIDRGSTRSLVPGRALGTTLLVAFAVVSVSAFVPVKTLRDGQPLWQPAFAAAVAVCRAHPNVTTVQVAEAPATWAADLPCRVLR